MKSGYFSAMSLHEARRTVSVTEQPRRLNTSTVYTPGASALSTESVAVRRMSPS
jgi:hypothetical protein